MAHGERANRLSTNGNKEYWKRRPFSMASYPTDGHADAKSIKRMTARVERRKAKQQTKDDPATREATDGK